MVDKSLSRGLADRVLDELAGRGVAYAKSCRAILCEFPEKRHAVRAIAESLRAAGEQFALTQIIGRHPKWRWAASCAFVPEIGAAPGHEGNRTIACIAVRTYVHVDRQNLGNCEPATVLAIQEHAVERLFMRLNVMDSAAVRAEMHGALCLAIPLLNAALELRLSQVVVPTRSGAFRCTVDPVAPGLVAKTWISKADARARDAEIVPVIERWYAGFGGETALAEDVVSLPVDQSLTNLPAPAGLARALHAFDWLKEPYTPRPDPIGDTWRKARSQARAAE